MRSRERLEKAPLAKSCAAKTGGWVFVCNWDGAKLEIGQSPYSHSNIHEARERFTFKNLFSLFTPGVKSFWNLIRFSFVPFVSHPSLMTCLGLYTKVVSQMAMFCSSCTTVLCQLCVFGVNILILPSFYNILLVSFSLYVSTCGGIVCVWGIYESEL